MFTSDQELEFTKLLFRLHRDLGHQHEGMFLAGGALRDSALNKNIKDYDVFVIHPSPALEKKIAKFSAPPAKYNSIQKDFGEFTVYNLGFVAKYPIQIIVTPPSSIEGVLKTFDYDCNQIAYNESGIIATSEFEDFWMQDVNEALNLGIIKHLTKTFEEFTDYEYNRYINLYLKYRDLYYFVDKSGNAMSIETTAKFTKNKYKTIFGGVNKYIIEPAGPPPARLNLDDLAREIRNRPAPQGLQWAVNEQIHGVVGELGGLLNNNARALGDELQGALQDWGNNQADIDEFLR